MITFFLITMIFFFKVSKMDDLLFKVGDLVWFEPPKNDDSIKEGLFIVVPNDESKTQRLKSRPNGNNYYIFLDCSDGTLDYHYYIYSHRYAKKLV